MIETLGFVLAGLSLVVLVGAALVGYGVWRSNRRMDDAETSRVNGGSGGPTEPP